jgi:hypothetical protein
LAEFGVKNSHPLGLTVLWTWTWTCNIRAGYQTQCIDTGPVLYCIDTYDTLEGLNRQYYNVSNPKKIPNILQ